MNKCLLPIALLVLWGQMDARLGAQELAAQELAAQETQPAGSASAPALQANGDGGATIVFSTAPPPEPAFLYASSVRSMVRVATTGIEQTIDLKVRVIQGRGKTVSLGLNGPGDVAAVQGEGLLSWSVRQQAEQRFVDLQIAPETQELVAVLSLRTTVDDLPSDVELAHLTPANSIGFDSQLQVEYGRGLSGRVLEAVGFAPLAASGQSVSFQSSSGGRIILRINRQSALVQPVEITDSHLLAELDPNGKSVSIRLSGNAQVTQAGAKIDILLGNAALGRLSDNAGYRLQLVERDSRPVYELSFPEVGTFPIELDLVASTLHPETDWDGIDFKVAASAVVPITLRGFGLDLEFKRTEQTVVPIRDGDSWRGFLPASGRVNLQWKDARDKEQGQLFFSTSAKVEAQVGTGLLRQEHLLEYRVLQGQLKTLAIRMVGPGEIVDVEGPHLVGWKVDVEGEQRTLQLSLAQPIADTSEFTVRSQTPLGTFPVRVEGMRLQPSGALRHSGYLRVSNAGSVRVEPTALEGLTQLAPEQYPGAEITGRQLFVYRFPSAEHAFAVIADRVQSEVNVNQLVLYQLSDTDRVIAADIELDIREAPIREWDMAVPSDYSVVAVTGAGLADYVTGSEVVESQRNVKLVFAQDVQGRQLVRVRLEKSLTAAEGDWNLPRLDFPAAKSVRGDVGVAAVPGYRLSVATADSLAEKPLSYFPTVVANLQLAFRIREPNWIANVSVEALERSTQSDMFHLYSLSQGTIFGSALVNYFITGSPLSELQLTVPADLGNVTVDGQDIRAWRREGDRLLIALQQPVMGSYTLLITYEEKPNENDGSFTAGRVTPLDVQGDRGYVEIVSPIQVEVERLLVSGQLLVLDPLELPAEFRLLSTAPTLGAWQYTERPFDLKLKVNWFQPGTTAAQVVEFSEANSRLSPDGELVTDVVYYVKSRGQRSLRVQLPPAPVRLWSVMVNGQPVTARQTGTATLIPLPGSADPNTPVEVSLRLGKPSVAKTSAELTLPILFAPVLKTEWKIAGDENYVVVASGGNVHPTTPVLSPTGFEWLSRQGLIPLAWIAAVSLLGVLIDRRSGPRLLALIAFVVAVGCAAYVGWNAWVWSLPLALRLDLPVLAAGEAVELEVQNVPGWRVGISWLGIGLLLLGGVMSTALIAARHYIVGRVALFVAFSLMAVGLLLQANGAPWFFGLLAIAIVGLQVIPTAGNWWGQRMSKSSVDRPAATIPDADQLANPGDAGIVSTSLLCIAAWMTLATWGVAPLAAAEDVDASLDGMRAADSLQQEWIVSSEQSRLIAKGTWSVTGKPGDRFLLLQSPAILTQFSGQGLRLTKLEAGDSVLQYIVTIPLPEEGAPPMVDEPPGAVAQTYTASFEYQLEAVQPTTGIPVLTGLATLHLLEVHYDEPGWQVSCATAARIELGSGEPAETVANILLGSEPSPILLQPQSRDLSTEQTQFFVEGANLYTVGPGVVDGRHRLAVRISQGRIGELIVVVPEGLTVSSVDGPVAAWQFDADNRRLKLQIASLPESSFHVVIDTQRGLEALPATVGVSPLRVLDAAGEVGLVGIAAGTDAQPESIESVTFSPVSLSDFDSALQQNAQAVLHKVFRYGADAGDVQVRVAAVTPEVRVVSQQVLSLGDERVVLAVNFTAEISRTGLFQLSFPLPPGMEVESLSGEALDHWSELSEEGGRKVVLHLNGKTLGSPAFALTLAGTAPPLAGDWSLPRFELLEADRQAGEIVVRPMTGLRLRTVSRQNVSEADPRSMGGQAAGALAYRLLQGDWELTLGIERLDPWITGQVVHDVTLREGQTRSTVSAELNIENASIRSLLVNLPVTDVDELKTVRASGVAVSDFVRSANDANVWELQFARGVIGKIQFQIEYERRGDRTNDSETLRPLTFPDVRQLATYFAVRTGGRLEIEPAELAEGWQKVDWSIVPSSLRDVGNQQAPALALRAMAPATPMGIRVVRHALAEALKLRVAEATLTSILSPTGDQLTAVDVTMEVIQRSSLSLQLPEQSELISIFVNGESVHSIRQQNNEQMWQFNILPGMDDRTAQVRFVYLLRGDGLSKFQLLSPQLNVPLENVTWKVVAPSGYEMSEHDGDLELVGAAVAGAEYNRQTYLARVKDRRESQAKQAVELLQQANQLLQDGEQSKARWAFNNVANRNALDAASNEDARVQLENLQTQQAVVGLNSRRQRLFLDNDRNGTTVASNEQMLQAAAVNPVLNQDQATFRPQELSQLLAGNTSEDNAVLQQIAARLVQHQRATEGAPPAIVISLPTEGTTYTFRRSVQVTESAPLQLDLSFKSLFQLRDWQWLVLGGLVGGILFILAISKRGQVPIW